MVFPGFKAVTLPLSTDAMEPSVEVHITFLLVALEGDTVAVNVSVSPSTNEMDSGLRVIFVTLTVSDSF